MGFVEDHLLMISMLFGTALMLLIGVYLIGAVLTVPQLQSASATVIQQNFTYLDGIMIVGVIMLTIAEVLLAYFLPSHPVFFIIYLLVVLVTFVIAPIYTNLYTIMATNPTFAAAAQLLPYTAAVMNNLPMISLIISGLVALATYAKRPQQQAFQELL